MNIHIKNPEKIIRRLTLVTLAFMVCCGLCLVFIQIKPFWVDEWRIIYNLKYKTPAALWGQLDFMQQFPRLYLELIKAFTSSFNYSYFVLRLPSFLVATFTIIFCYRLMNRLYAARQLSRFLFILILVSSYTFTKYFVQVKQYTMDILLSLVAIWQLVELLQLRYNKTSKGKYLLLCLSFLIAPFFSYTYPIAVVPVFIILFIQGIRFVKEGGGNTHTITTLRKLWLPLLIGCISITAFYFADAAQLMRDKQMQNFWQNVMMLNGFHLSSFLKNFYNLFAQVGSGDLYNIIFGITGIAAFLFGLVKTCRSFYKANDLQGILILYSVLLISLSLLLFIMKKLPLGEPRLNVYTVPAIAMLIIYLIDSLRQQEWTRKYATVLFAVLYIGVAGNIFTTFTTEFFEADYHKKLHIYMNTENAIMLAQANNLPMLVTPGVAFPYDTTQNLPYHNNVPGDWVLKTYPAYNANKKLAVYAISSLSNIKEAFKTLPPNITKAIAGDGISFYIVSR